MWNKKALAILTAATFVGVLSPISANAWEDINPDEIVTATVDLGTGNGGGGGGGGTYTCTGYSTLDVPTNTLPLTYQTTRVKSTWVDDQSTDGADGNGDFTDDTAVENLSWNALNTQRDYVSDEFEITFDANNCVGSLDWASLNFERQPVETSVSGSGWEVAEITSQHGVLEASQNKAKADLILDRGLVNGNVTSVRVFDNTWDASWIANQDITSTYFHDWDAMSDTISGLSQPQGTSGVANLTAILTLFGDEAKGKYRVKYGIDMWIND